jgi:hypothetical protein
MLMRSAAALVLRGRDPVWLIRVVTIAVPAMLTALAIAQVRWQATECHELLVLVVALGVAGVFTLLKAPLPLVLVVAAVVAALCRQL